MRTYLILQKLAKANSYLSLNYFVDELKVSKRTVQNELAFIKKAGDSHGYQLRNVYGKGYALEIVDPDKIKVFLIMLSDDGMVLNEEQMVIDVLNILLTDSIAYTPVAGMADTLGLSATALYTKLKIVDTFVASFGLKLERRSHYGVRLIGKSQAIRTLMLDFYLKGDNRFRTITDKRVGNFAEYERMAEDCIRESHLRIGYYEFQQLMAWFKVLIVYSTGKFALQQIRFTPLNQDVEPVAKNLDCVLHKIMKNFRIEIDQETAEDFSALVRQSIQKKKVSITSVDKNKLCDNLTDFFTASDIKNHTDYAQDLEFFNQLITHLLFLFDRLDEKITYKNPLLLDLCIRYPLVFDLVLKFSEFLRNRFGAKISNDELGFIAVHFLNHVVREQNERIRQYERIAVICTTGGGVSNLVRTQILGVFPQAEVCSFSFWEESDLQIFKPNLIFSVVPLKHEPNVPTIYINELLSSRDIANIKHMLFIDGLPKKIDVTIDVSAGYLELFRPDLFVVTGAKDYTNLISDMGQCMIDQGYGDLEYRKNVMLREQYMGTIYKNGIAMPHPLEMRGKRSAIEVAVVKPEIEENGRNIRLVFMVCLAKKDFQFYSNISNGIFQLMQSPQLISLVYNQPLLSTLVATLKEMEG